MLELDFKGFMEQLDNLANVGKDPQHQLHYVQETNKFILYIKSDDLWEYMTTVKVSEIVEFGLKYEVDNEQAIKDFKQNFLYNAIRLKDSDPIVINEPEALTKEAIIDAGEEMVEEATDYNDFLVKKFDRWEKAINTAIDRDLKEELKKDYVEKTLGGFLSSLFNTVNTSDFMAGLRRVISISFKQGLADAEKELNMDIGVSVDFNKVVKIAADRQIEGFMIDGKRWKGLKGVTADLQNDVSQIVSDGINKKSPNDIQKDIHELFIKNRGGKVNGKITEGRTMKIARTETNRFVNSGKLQGFKDSGLKGQKQWSAFIDDKTTDICRELNGQKKGLYELFETSKGLKYDIPPHGPNCRSVIDFVFD